MPCGDPFVDAAEKSVKAMKPWRSSDDEAEMMERLKAIAKYVDEPKHHEAVVWAMARILNLRASQFRWIPVSERVPTDADYSSKGLVLLSTQGTVFTQYKHTNSMVNVDYWAPIPPMPEKSQEEKDEELWNNWCIEKGFKGCVAEHNLRAGFIGGLKAARGEKP